MQENYLWEPFKERSNKIESKTNAERFLDAFVSIEQSLNRILRTSDYVPFGNLIKRAARRIPVVNNRLDVLKEYGVLRNAIVHQRGDRTEIIAEPNDYVTRDIERIAFQLNASHNILTYATQPVKHVKGTDSIRVAYRYMMESNTTKVPVYEGKKCSGLLCLESITKWAMNGKDPKTTVRDLLNQDGSERVVFVDRLATIEEVIEIFDRNMKNHRPSPVIIISEHGLRSEKPIGILSSYDLTKIIAILS